jgi:serine/threonine protein kinase
MVDRINQHLGNYRLIKQLGKGGFATVYLGEHVLLKTQAAIKVFNTPVTDESTLGFLKEARTVAALDHAHIISVLDCGVDGHTPFLVMKYAPGGTLRQRYPRGSRLSSDKIVHYVTQIADALQYAHDKKIIHRDVKPANMLLGLSNTVYLSDFGIALIAQTTQITQDIIGTLDYMAPEQFVGRPSRASDQYSLGIVVYEWICGTVPFQGTEREIYSQQRYSSPLSLRIRVPEISREVEQVVLKALEKDPQDRFENVQTFADALKRAYQGRTMLKNPLAIDRTVQAAPIKKYPDSSKQESLNSRQLNKHVLLPQQSATEQKLELPEQQPVTVRFALQKFTDYLLWFLLVLESVLALRFVMKVLGADPGNVFCRFYLCFDQHTSSSFRWHRKLTINAPAESSL